MSDHIAIREGRRRIFADHPWFQLGRNGILGDYVNSFTSVSTWLGFLQENVHDPDKFKKYSSKLQEIFQNMELYEEWELFSRDLWEGKSLIDDPEMKRLLFESEDIKPIIDAMNTNVEAFRGMAEIFGDMTQEKWWEQWDQISQTITWLIEKQKSLLHLWLQDESVDSIEDIKSKVHALMNMTT